MEFGRIEQFDEIDFKLGSTPNISLHFLENLEKNQTKSLYVGGTGWTMPEWVGSWYPSNTKPKDFLKAYSQQFNSIECNVTFYQIPSIQTVNQWKSVVPADFKFCIKVFQGISRADDFGESEALFDQFISTISHLESQIGVIFIQFPNQFSIKNQLKLMKWLDQLNLNFPLLLEFRHPSWFQQFENNPDFLNFLNKRKMGLVITDVQGRRDVLHQYIPNDTIIVRFVATNQPQIDFKRLDDWIDNINHWYSVGLLNVYFFMHSFDSNFVPVLVQYMIEHSNSKWITNKLTLPTFFENDGKQLSLF